MPKTDEFVSIKVAKVLYDDLASVGAKTGLSQRFMLGEALDWWLEVKAPIEIQHAEKVRAHRRKS